MFSGWVLLLTLLVRFFPNQSCKVAVLRKSRKGYPCWTSFQEWGNIFLKNHVQTLIGPFLVNQGVAYFHPKPYPAILSPPLSPDPSLEIREGGWWSSRPLDKGRGGAVSPQKFVLALQASFWSKNKGGGALPWIYHCLWWQGQQQLRDPDPSSQLRM